MFWFFGGKKEVVNLKEDVKKSFDSVKKDISSVGGWIKHLESEKNIQKKEINDLKDILSSVKEEIEGLKNVISIVGEFKSSRSVQTNKQLLNKQTVVEPVQTGVQTGVQTPNLDLFSITEKAILWVLLNTDLKLSYEDLAAMLNKKSSTLRGQINSIKQKSEGFIIESVEKNGKKRLHVPEEIKEKILKNQKVSVKRERNKK